MYDDEQETELENLPECCECGHKIQDEYYFEFDGKCICEECINENHRKFID
jgi:hypothetical protein